MTQEMSGNITNMVWRPQFIKLTHVAYRDAFDGKETPCFVDPQQIICIRRTISVVEYAEGEKEKQPATTVYFSSMFYINVIETPEEVARLRDKAYGFAPQLKAVE